MTGLSRFDFYPRDWFLDTRDLSHAAKGIYVDLFAAMYARGGPLPHDERELCKLTGCATVRSLRPLLQELFDKGKLRLQDGQLVNGRTMQEIEKANRKMADGAKGGKTRSAAVRAEYDGNTTGTQAETEGGFFKKQADNLNPPSPSPSPPTSVPKGTGPTARAVDPAKEVYDLGKRLLTAYEIPKSSQGALITKWRKALGNDDKAMMTVLMEAQSAERDDIVAFITGAIRARRGNGTGRDGRRQPDPDAERKLHAARLRAFRDDGLWDTAWGPRPDDAPGDAA